MEEAWKVMKECMLVSVSRVCGIEKRRNAEMRTRWWNDEVQCEVSRKKMTSKLMFDVGREEAR